jgi:UDPglucose--hexose-1-phosphate uridylyltransferase
LPELRRDAVSGRWVIIATERAARPASFYKSRDLANDDPDACPFCHGREARTPPEIYAVREPGSAPDGPGWAVRVVPNKYPALGIEGRVTTSGGPLFETMDGVGAHEVIVESPEHDTHPAIMPVAQLTNVLRTYRERYVDLARDKRFQYAMLFRNHGHLAGATVGHPHSQLIALPILPRHLVEELEGARAYFAEHARCVFCDLIDSELRTGTRVVHENRKFLAFNPYASRFPYETWILPRFHQASFADLADEDLAPMADALQTTLNKLYRVLDNPPYNFALCTAPYAPTPGHFYHWHIKIMPRVTAVAGFEWGTGFYINVMPPEEAARSLRESAPPLPTDERPGLLEDPPRPRGG